MTELSPYKGHGVSLDEATGTFEAHNGSGGVVATAKTLEELKAAVDKASTKTFGQSCIVSGGWGRESEYHKGTVTSVKVESRAGQKQYTFRVSFKDGSGQRREELSASRIYKDTDLNQKLIEVIQGYDKEIARMTGEKGKLLAKMELYTEAELLGEAKP